MFGRKAVARETMILASEMKSHWWTRQLMAKLKVMHKWVGLGLVQSFMLILGRVGLGYFTCG